MRVPIARFYTILASKLIGSTVNISERKQQGNTTPLILSCVWDDHDGDWTVRRRQQSRGKGDGMIGGAVSKLDSHDAAQDSMGGLPDSCSDRTRYGGRGPESRSGMFSWIRTGARIFDGRERFT